MTATGARSAAPPDEPVGRFIEAIERLAPEDGRIGVAVSGGPDSMAMLLLAHAAIPGQFEVATVNHGLRPESAEECALVALACAELEIPCAILTVEVGQGNLQEQARVARYEALGAWAKERGLSAVATAHHADDQAETLVMRLNRGSGLSGLTGVRPRTMIGVTTFIRPLLRFRRSELAKLVESSDLVFVTDPSNENESFDRVRIRKVLAEADWLDPLAVARSAELLAEAEFYVSDALNRCWQASVQATEDGYRYRPGYSSFENGEIVMHILQAMGNYTARSDVARVVERLWRGENASLGGTLGVPGVERNGEGVDGRIWVFRPEPPRSG